MTLRGVGWDHTRAMIPLLGLSQVWRDRHGEDGVIWDTRSLVSFAEAPLDEFNQDYDLIVYDYPFAGEALAQDWLYDLNTLLPADLLAARRRGAVGRAFDSFTWNGRQAALPVDAATHVSCWRADLLEAAGEETPSSWTETIALAERTGKVAMPLTRTAIWGTLIDFCAHAGKPALTQADQAFPRQIALEAWEQISRLVAVLPRWCFESSPVKLLNRMSGTDDVLFCPLTYGYSTYAMRGYAAGRIVFGDMRLTPDRPPSGAILGGAGIGVSRRSRDPERAARFAAWLTSDEVQSGLYAQFGGQPAAVAAWDDPDIDRMAGGFYASTRASMDGCYHRPNGPGFHDFQTLSCHALHQAIQGQTPIADALDVIEIEWARWGRQDHSARRKAAV